MPYYTPETPNPTLLAAYRASIDLSNFPRKFIESWYNPALLAEEKGESTELHQWYTERYQCCKDALFLSGYAEAAKAGDPDLPKSYVPIMGMDFQQDPHAELFKQFVPMQPGSGLVLSDLDNTTKKRMILWSRGTFKTSSIIVEITQVILNYPNVRICFLTGGDKLAKRQLARVKKVFEKPSKRFAFLFPEYCLKSGKLKKTKYDKEGHEIAQPTPPDEPCKMGTAFEFTVPCRTNDTFAEPTFAISTARSVKSGSHYDMIFIDDLVNDQNYRSVKALEKCYDDYLDICPVLDPVGFMIVTGTRYSFGDTYERIQEMAREEEKKLGRTIWKFSIRDCWSMGCENCPHTDVYHNYDVNILQPPCTVPGCHCVGFHANGSKGVLFPETRTVDKRSIGHTLEFLEGERIRLGPEFFANQYENKPLAAEDQTFSEALIGRQTIHHETDIPSYSVSYTFAVGDLAYVGQEGRDFSVIYICRLFQGRIYIFDCLFGNWDSDKIAENTTNVLLKFRPAMVYYEKFNGWEAYNNIITTHAAAKGIQKVPIQWETVSLADKAKLARIGSVKGPLSNARLWLYSLMPGYDRLVQQLIKWPKLGRHDDFADCAGMVVSAPTGYQNQNPMEIVSTTNWLRKFNQAQVEAEPDSRPAGSYGEDYR